MLKISCVVPKGKLDEMNEKLAKTDCIILESEEQPNNSETRIEIICANAAQSKVSKTCQDISRSKSIHKITISSNLHKKPIPKKQDKLPSRLVPLQKQTLAQSYATYMANKDQIQYEYEITTFAAFVNYCVSSYLPIFEEKIKEESIMFAKILN